MKGKSAWLAGVAAIALVANAGYAKNVSDATSAAEPAPAAAPAGPSNAELAARLQALEDQLQADEAKTQTDHTRLSTLEQNFNYASWTFDNGRPVISSGDGRFTLAFRVRFQEDLANFFQDDAATLAAHNVPAAARDLSTGAVTRRAYFGIEGKAFNDFVYEFRFNGGGTNGSAGTGVTGSEGDPLVNLARVAYMGIPYTRINVGVIEPVFMYEGTFSSAQLPFLERPEIDNIAADTFGAGDSRRGVEVTFQKQGLLKGDDNFVLSAAFTGAKTGSSTGHGAGGDEQSQLLGRTSYRFWSDGISNAMIGASGATILYAGPGVTSFTFQDRPEIRVDGTRLVSAAVSGAKHASMYSFDAGANIENFYIGGEWAHFDASRAPTSSAMGDHPSFSGWYVEGTWVLTGEVKSYTVSATNNEVGGFGSPKVASPFSLSGDSWGAFELAARYSDTDLNWHTGQAAVSGTPTTGILAGVVGGDERIIDAGINWYLNNEVKIQLHDSFVNVNRLAAAGGTTKAGQNLNILGVRLQFSN